MHHSNKCPAAFLRIFQVRCHSNIYLTSGPFGFSVYVLPRKLTYFFFLPCVCGYCTVCPFCLKQSSRHMLRCAGCRLSISHLTARCQSFVFPEEHLPHIGTQSNNDNTTSAEHKRYTALYKLLYNIQVSSSSHLALINHFTFFWHVHLNLPHPSLLQSIFMIHTRSFLLMQNRFQVESNAI